MESELKFNFRVGDVVEIVSATFGWGHAVKGDVCIVDAMVVDEGHKIYTLREDNGRYTRWNGEEADFVAFDMSDGKKVAQRAFNKYKSFLLRIPKLVDGCLSETTLELQKLEVEIKEKAMIKRSLQKYKNSAESVVEKSIADTNAVARYEILVQSMYEQINFIDSGSMILAVTKPINTVVDGIPLAFGRYTVGLHYRDGLQFISRKLADAEFDRSESKYQHPHILHCAPCLGDFHLPIVKNQEAMDFVGVLEVVHNYLCSVFPGSTYVSYLLWAPDRTKRCRNCKALLEKCTCGRPTRFDPRSCGDILRGGESEALFTSAPSESIPVGAVIGGTATITIDDPEEVCINCGRSAVFCNCFYCPRSGVFISHDGVLASEECDECEDNDDGVCARR